MATDKGDDGAEPRVPRRLVLKSLAAGVGFWEQACGAPPAEHPGQQTHAIAPAEPVESPIRLENRKLGTSAYLLQKPARAGEVEGYAAVCSASAGDQVGISVNVNRAQGVRWDLYRVGYYQGHGARLIQSGATVQVAVQAIPEADPHTGLLECAWPAAFSLTIDPTWLTGYYLLKLSNDDGFESYVPLIVCETGRKAPLLVQASVTTWQAYNLWGGINLYINHLPSTAKFHGPRGYQVSFDRPYGPDVDIGYVEHSMVRWLEQQGYDAAYVTNIDIDRSPELLNERHLFMSVGHDEYWSLNERSSVQRMRDEGLSIAFFSGNTAYRRIRFAHSSAGAEYRIITCYKSGTADPHRHAPDTTADYQQQPYPQPENGLVGVLWAGWALLEGFAFVVTKPDHWLFEGTGVQAGDTLGHVVGYEWDIAGHNSVSPDGLEIVSESPALHEYGYGSTAQATVYYPTRSSFVFGAGTIGWAKGLSEPGVRDPRVERVTQNVLLRAGLEPEARIMVPSRAALEPVRASSARAVAGTGAAGNADGPLAAAQLNAPGGVAAGPSGELYVCDTGNNALRKVSSDGQLATVALNDASGAKVRLATPTGVVVDARGRVYLCDTGNHRILMIDEQGVASVYAGHTHVSGRGDADSPLDARFSMPRGLALDPVGALYVADFRNDAIRRIDASGVSTILSNAGGPTALSVGPDGMLYFLASHTGSIVSLSQTGVRTVLANPKGAYGDRGGAGEQAALRPADGLIYTSHGLVFSDTANNRVRLLAFDAAHTVSTVLGTGRGGAGVGEGAQTEISVPRGLSTLGSGFAVADSANHRVLYFELPEA